MELSLLVFRQLGKGEGEAWSNPTPRAGLSTRYSEVIKAVLSGSTSGLGTAHQDNCFNLNKLEAGLRVTEQAKPN